MAAIIFDFDGTIADTFETVVATFHELTKRQEPVSEEEITHLRGLPSRGVLKRLGIPLWKVPFLLRRGRRLMGQRMATVTQIPGMADVIKSLRGSGHELFIISTNSEPNIGAFLKQHELDDCFSEIIGNVGLFGKAPALRKLTKRHALDPKTIFYVADEVRDIQAAERAGVRCVAVTWGYNSASILQVHKPFALISKPNELLAIASK